MIHKYQLNGCLYGTVLVYHLIRPNIGNIVHGVSNDRDLRMGITVWLIVCHGRLYTLSSRSCTVWDFETTTWLLYGGLPSMRLVLNGAYILAQVQGLGSNLAVSLMIRDWTIGRMYAASLVGAIYSIHTKGNLAA